MRSSLRLAVVLALASAALALPATALGQSTNPLSPLEPSPTPAPTTTAAPTTVITSTQTQTSGSSTLSGTNAILIDGAEGSAHVEL